MDAVDTRDAAESASKQPDSHQYTTAGTVWQPRSTPRQPPQRRGRALKTFPSQTFSDNFYSLDDNNIVPSFNHPSTPSQYSLEYYTHQHPQQLPSRTHQVTQYSPLQQNFDRAVSPLRLGSTPVTPQQTHNSDLYQTNSLEEYHYNSAANMSGQQKRVVPVVPIIPLTPLRPGQGNKGENKQGDITNRGNAGTNTVTNRNAIANPNDVNNPNATVEGEGEETDEIESDVINTLMQMPTKTVVNLTTYDNPMRKAAQKVLAMARQPPQSIGNQAFSQPQSIRPPPGLTPPTGPSAMGRSGMGTSIPGSSAMGSLAMGPPGMRSANTGSGFNQSFSDLTYKPYAPSPSMSTTRDSSYPAILARGPGAPQPLTAGPPGQRQFRTGFDGREANPLESISSRYPSLSSVQTQQEQQRAMQAAMQQPNLPRTSGNPPVNRWGAPTVPWGMNAGRPAHEKMSDTLTEEEARKFYPNGLPADFNRNTATIPDNWQEQRLREVREEEMKSKNATMLQSNPEWQAAHKAQLHRDFYGGNDMINKSIHMAIHEQNSRQMIRAIGSEMQESKKAQGRVENRKLTVEEADKIPTHEHAEPLLSMLYQTLAERPGQPKSQAKPDNKK